MWEGERDGRATVAARAREAIIICVHIQQAMTNFAVAEPLQQQQQQQHIVGRNRRKLLFPYYLLGTFKISAFATAMEHIQTQTYTALSTFVWINTQTRLCTHNVKLCGWRYTVVLHEIEDIAADSLPLLDMNITNLSVKKMVDIWKRKISTFKWVKIRYNSNVMWTYNFREFSIWMRAANYKTTEISSIFDTTYSTMSIWTKTHTTLWTRDSLFCCCRSSLLLLLPLLCSIH